MLKRRNTRQEFIKCKQKRSVAFYKRKKGIINKAKQLENLTNSKVIVLISSETNKIYAYSSNELKDVLEQIKEILAEKIIGNIENDI